MEWISLYLRLLRVNLRILATDRTDFLISLGTHLLFHFEALGLIWTLLHHFPGLGGWQLPEVALFYSMFLLGKAAADVIGEPLLLLPELVRTGDLDRALTRPLPVLFQVLTAPHQAPGAGVTLAIALAAVALPRAPVDWSPLRVAVLAGGVAGAAAIQLAFRLLTGATTFWLLEADDLRELMHDLITEFGRYPTAIFARPLQWLLHVVPTGFIAYYPSAWLLGRDGALLPVALGAALSPIAAATWLRLGTGAWRTGLRRYTSTGS